MKINSKNFSNKQNVPANFQNTITRSDYKAWSKKLEHEEISKDLNENFGKKNF